MEALVLLIMVFVGCGITLAIIFYIACQIENKIDNWLTDRALRKKFGNKWEL